MSVQQKKFLKIFLVIDAVLFIVFIATLIPFRRRGSTKSFKSALLNVNKISDISGIRISKADSSGETYSIQLEKAGDFWTGRDSFTDTLWPADNQNVANLIDRCSQIVNVYTSAMSSRAWESFGLDEKDATFLGFYGPGGEKISEILFGNVDPLNSRIAFRTLTGNEEVYQMNSSISSYISVSSSFWADPFVFPQALTGYSRIKSESILRHGALTSFSDPSRGHDFLFRKDFDNGASARFLIYKNAEENGVSYTIVPVFTPGPSASGPEKQALENFNYVYSMSQWTLEKFSEEVKQIW